MGPDEDMFAGAGPTDDTGLQSPAPHPAKKSHRNMSLFSATQLIPENFPSLDLRDSFDHDQGSSSHSADGPSVFDHAESHDNEDPSQFTASSPGAQSGYSLMPPPPNVTLSNAERLADRLFSVDHLDLIIRHQPAFGRFTSFLNKYRPRSVPTLARYLETRKAMAAVDYANAIALEMAAPNQRSSSSSMAAHISSKFEARSRRAVDDLITDALPAYVTHRLTQVVTEFLVKEITGNSPPLNRHLAEGLAEVYCLADPSLPDNPIVYASDEFHLTTQYGRHHVIGRNCRFLQGPKSSPVTIQRISEAIKLGHEICETILNYRRDGSPFINLCMVAPLYDNKGNVRYFIGCQIDVTNLIEGGKGLESFQMLLDQDLAANQHHGSQQRGALKAMGSLGELLSTEEVELIKHKTRNSNSRSSTPGLPSTPSFGARNNHHFVGVDDPLEINVWPPTQFGPHGRLPGVYQNFMLVRPWPSLRIIFTSAALRIPGLVQTRLLDRIGGPHSVREGIATAFAEGARVTAKVLWLMGSTGGPYPNNGSGNDGARDSQFYRARSSSIEGKPRYIHCTPLLGSDGAPGVWMVVMVENEEVTGSLNSAERRRRRIFHGGPVGGGSQDSPLASGMLTHDKLFAQYRLREGSLGSNTDVANAGGGGRGRGRSRTNSQAFTEDTHFVDEDHPPPVSGAYAEYLANSSRRGSANASRQPSRPQSRNTPSRCYSVPPEGQRKQQQRDERVTRRPLPSERLGEVDEQ